MRVSVTGGSDVMRLYTTSLLTLVLYVSVSGSSAFKCSTSTQSSEVAKVYFCGTDNQTRESNSADQSGEAVEHQSLNSKEEDSGEADEHQSLSSKEEDSGCQYSYNSAFENCSSNTSPTSPACWKVLDANGTVEVSFPLLPQRCKYNIYKAELTVLETSDDKCLNFSKNGTHSNKELHVENCSKPSCSGPCIQRGTLTFWHVFSGCYQLVLIPYQNLQAYTGKELRTVFVYLDTKHVKTPIKDEKYLQIEDISDRRDALKASFGLPPLVFHVKLELKLKENKDSKGCYGDPLTNVYLNTTSPSEDILCDSDYGKSNVSCSLVGNEISCTFSQLKAGNYCVQLDFVDDRCKHRTVWGNGPLNVPICEWHTTAHEINPKDAVTEIREPAKTDKSFNYIYLLIVLSCLLVLVGGVTCWWRTRQYREDPSNNFSPILTPAITAQVTDSPLVLLLYARDCPAFLEAVAQLRKVLKKACNCEVMDCWEESQYQDVAQNSVHWLMSKLFEEKVHTVFITSPASIHFEFCIIKGSKVCYKQPKAFDHVLELALNHLHENYSHETYRRLLIVRLGSKGEGVLHQSTTFLNPLTTYELPVHLNALLATLQNMNPTEYSFLANMASDERLLANAISKYQLYLKEHPSYLDSLLVAENSTIEHCV